MEITKNRLKVIIKEELENFMEQKLIPDSFDDLQQAAVIALQAITEPDLRKAVIDHINNLPIS